jgi:hypothetical protein
VNEILQKYKDNIKELDIKDLEEGKFDKVQ